MKYTIALSQYHAGQIVQPSAWAEDVPGGLCVSYSWYDQSDRTDTPPVSTVVTDEHAAYRWLQAEGLRIGTGMRVADAS